MHEYTSTLKHNYCMLTFGQCQVSVCPWLLRWYEKDFRNIVHHTTIINVCLLKTVYVGYYNICALNNWCKQQIYTSIWE